MSQRVEPGVLPCGCLWDGSVLSIERGCADTHDALGRVAYVRHRLSINGKPMDSSAFPVDRGTWLWDESG